MRFGYKITQNGELECNLYREDFFYTQINVDELCILYLKIPKNGDSECNVFKKGRLFLYVKYSWILRFVSQKPKTENRNTICIGKISFICKMQPDWASYM